MKIFTISLSLLGLLGCSSPSVSASSDEKNISSSIEKTSSPTIENTSSFSFGTTSSESQSEGITEASSNKESVLKEESSVDETLTEDSTISESSSEESVSETSVKESSTDSSIEEESSSEWEPSWEYPMPIFRIDTEDSTPITSKEVYVPGSLTIENAGKYDDEDLTLGIRGRGNYSWSGTEKKSYRIKFDSKYQPLGQGNGPCKSWTLLAVHCDKSMLRNDAAFYFASKLGSLPFVSSSSFVELYLNGSYDGVYELCDQTQVNKYRVNVDDSGEEEDIGYLVELDKNASEDVVRISDNETFEVKSDYKNQAQLDFIENYLDSCYLAIKSGSQDKIEELIDIPTSIDAYLVEEVFKNLDVGWGSFYYTKPKGGKLQFGPVWDFDLTSGNANSDNQDIAFRSYQYTYVGNPYFESYMQQHKWYSLLRKTDWYNELIAQRYLEVKDYIEETVEHIAYMADTYHEGFIRNFERWDIWDQQINREPSNIMKIKYFDGQVEYLKNWLTKREEWLTKFYNGEVKDIKKGNSRW